MVAGIASKDFYLGYFGLGPAPTNLTTLDNPRESLLSTLKEQNLLPSISWGYTAGASYRLKGVDGSLTLGGYDSSRFIQSSVSCNFADDNTRNLVVGLQSITTDSSDDTQTVINLLPNSTLAFIDSTVSHIWLPLDSCQAFEQTFGLVYDSATELYLINDTLHDSLIARNASITFQFGNDLTSVETVNITLSYASFDLELTSDYPGIINTTRYFPIRRAANDTQNTLGRTFLQEAYLIADYERSNFPEPASLTVGSIVGIAIAAIAVCLILAVGMFVGIRKRRSQHRHDTKAAVWEKAELHNIDVDLTRPRMGELQEITGPVPELSTPYEPKTELEALGRLRGELQGSVNVHELVVESVQTYELP
ncbi:hypothetical protein MMC17_010196 [Xylographa soralifera]|nr:hypothetical protein [Xylographa soralifera]